MTSRSLTPGEIALARSVFGNSIPYEQVRINNSSYSIFQRTDTVMAPNGSIYFPDGNSVYRSDFSVDGNIRVRAFFLHEMTHVWQHHNGYNVVLQGFYEHVSAGTWLNSSNRAAYQYQLDANKNFSDYGIEQQASIVADYYLYSDGNHLTVPRFVQALRRLSIWSVLALLSPPVLGVLAGRR